MSQERRSPKARGKSGRSPSRGVARSPAPQPFGRRGKPPGLVARIGRALVGLFSIRRPVLWLTAGVLALTAIAAFLASGVIGRTVGRTDAAAGALVSDAGFAVSQVHLAGNARTPSRQIVAALGFKPHQSIFAFDLRQARARLMQLPWIADAEVKRRYPDDISVRVVERVPYARWQSPGGLFVVERDGRPITATGADAFRHLPLILGEGGPVAAALFVEAVARHRAIAARVSGYQYQSGRRWNLLLDDGVVVKLPENGWRHQLDVLDHLIVDKGVLEANIREIDLRSATHYFFVRKNDAAEKDKKAETGSAI